jgi:hypothetical protein
MAVGEYQTNTSVESSAATSSVGAYRENPVSRAACSHTGSLRAPSTTISASMRGIATSSWRARPSY